MQPHLVPPARDPKNWGWTVPARPTCGTLSALARLWSAMSSTTLMSLAILKVTVDRGNDYLDQLRPFITQVLADHRPDPVTPSFVQGSLRSQFGLEIPQPTIALVLGRMARRPPLQKAHSVIRIVGDIPDPGLLSKHVESRRHIDAVLAGLIEFSRTTQDPLPRTKPRLQRYVHSSTNLAYHACEHTCATLPFLDPKDIPMPTSYWLPTMCNTCATRVRRGLRASWLCCKATCWQMR